MDSIMYMIKLLSSFVQSSQVHETVYHGNANKTYALLKPVSKGHFNERVWSDQETLFENIPYVI